MSQKWGREMNKFESQRKAVSMALREMRRDLLKAKRENNAEWIEDCEFAIKHLNATLETLQQVQAMSNLFRDEAQS
jgi:hypothetical protein